MGFKRIDDTTVADDDGNKYFMPDPSEDDAHPAEAPVQEPEPAATKPNEVKDEQDRKLDALLTYLKPDEAKPAADEIEMTGHEGEEAPDNQAAPSPDSPASVFAAHETAPPAPPAPLTRDQQIGGDLSGYAAKGGTLVTDSDLSRAQGGIANEQAQAAQAAVQGKHDVNQAAIDADMEKSKALYEAADQMQKASDRHFKEADEATNKWVKQVDEASKAVVDPNHAFTTMGGFGKAMWALQFIGAGMQGGQQVTATWGSLQKLLQDDIESQRSTNANRREGLSSEGQALRERIANTKENDLANAGALKMRLDAMGKALDAKIKAIGQAAADKAGLLQQRALIDQGTQKVLTHVWENNQKIAAEKTKQSFEVYNIRLKDQLDRASKIAEEEAKAKTAKADKITDLPTGTGLGLNAVDKATGQTADLVHLVANPEQRQKAGAILSSANEEASLLKEVEQDVKGMSKSDLIRGGGPEFAAKALELIQNRAKRFNGSRLSDADVQIAAKNEFGLDVATSGGFFSHLKGALLAPGDFKEGVEKAIATHRRNLASETTNQLLPYVDSEDAQKLNIQYNPQDVRVKAPQNTQRDVNTMIEQAAEGAPTRKVAGQSARKPLSGTQTVDENTAAVYEEQKDKGRGKPGGLPVLSEHDEAWVDRFSDDIKELHSRKEDTEPNVTAVLDGYLHNKKLTDEAKFEIQNAAFEALADYKKRNTKTKSQQMIEAAGAGGFTGGM